MGSIGLPELLVIGVIALLLFGSRLPQVARNFGKSIVEFKKGIKEVKEDAGKGDDQNQIGSGD